MSKNSRKSEYYLLQWAEAPDGTLVHIDSVPNGLLCECVCPKCKCRLEARNNGEIKAHHFAHYTEFKAHHSGVSGSTFSYCGVNDETIIHRAAKQILQESIGKTLMLPAVLFETYLPSSIIVNEARHVTIESVEIEKAYEDVIPDAIIHTTSGEQIFFEVFVSHRVDHEKLEKLNRIGVPCIEVDLRDYSASSNAFLVQLEKALLTDTEDKDWVYTSELYRLNKKKRQFERLLFLSGLHLSDPCRLLPADKRDNVVRCGKCPFYAGFYDSYFYCSASQLLNMKNIHMSEAEVSALVEKKRADYVFDHDRGALLLVNETEKAISSIGVVLDVESIIVIQKARRLYDSVPNEYKPKVTNYAILVAAESQLEELLEEEKQKEELEKKVKKVETEIGRLLFHNPRGLISDYQEYYNAMENGEYTASLNKPYTEQLAYAKWLFDNLPQEGQALVSNKAMLENGLSKLHEIVWEAEQRTAFEKKQALREKKEQAEIQKFLSLPVSKRKKIYQNELGHYMVEGVCPISASSSRPEEKYYAECRSCKYCEVNINHTGPEQFIICNAVHDTKNTHNNI